MQIFDIKKEDLLDIASLGADCFYDEPFYAEYKKKGKKGFKKLVALFVKSIEICVECGVAQKAVLDGKTVGFLLGFHYKNVKNNARDKFDQFFTDDIKHTQYLKLQKEFYAIDNIATKSDSMYLMTVAVSKKQRGKGVATALVNNFINTYKDYLILTDISNEIMWHICNKAGFEQVEEKVSDCVIAVKNTVTGYTKFNKDELYIAIPSDSTFLNGYEKTGKIIIEGVSRFDEACFKRVYAEHEEADVYKVDAFSYLCCQALLGLTSVTENCVDYTDKIALYYTGATDEYSSPDKNLYCYVAERKTKEEKLVVDVCTSIPMTYEKLSKIENSMKLKNDLYTDRLIFALDFRTEYESGIPVSNVTNRGYKDRIRRIGLGSINIQLKSEIEFDFARPIGQTDIGNSFKMSLILSIDKNSNLCVLHMIGYSFKEELTQYLDSVSRNQIEVIGQNGKVINLYDYLYGRFNLIKSGTAKNFVTAFENKEKVEIPILASVLFGETYYNDGESLGHIVDKDICEMIQAEHGVSQYNYADVFMNENIVVQMSESLLDTVGQRILRESVTMFYMELVLFEESAISCADDQIRKFLSRLNEKSSNSILKNYGRQLISYASTIDFWEIQMNYPSSQASIANMRKYFKINKLLEQYERDSGIFKKIYETKNNYADKVESMLLTSVGAILTTISVIELLWDTTGINKLAVAALIVAILLFLKNKILLKNGRNKHK